MNPKINTFIFDFFGVICDPILENWFKKNRTVNGQADNDLKSVLHNLDLGKLSEDDVNDYILKHLDIHTTKKELEKEIEDAFRVNTRIIDLIRGLKQKGYKTALLSNSNNSFFVRKVYPSLPEIKIIFDKIFISSLIGVVKPDPKIYLYSLEKLNSKPEETLFIDDNKTNVDGAVALGINGFVFTDNESFEKYINKIIVDIDS